MKSLKKNNEVITLSSINPPPMMLQMMMIKMKKSLGWMQLCSNILQQFYPSLLNCLKNCLPLRVSQESVEQIVCFLMMCKGTFKETFKSQTVGLCNF